MKRRFDLFYTIGFCHLQPIQIGYSISQSNWHRLQFPYFIREKKNRARRHHLFFMSTRHLFFLSGHLSVGVLYQSAWLRDELRERKNILCQSTVIFFILFRFYSADVSEIDEQISPVSPEYTTSVFFSRLTSVYWLDRWITLILRNLFHLLNPTNQLTRSTPKSPCSSYTFDEMLGPADV